MLVANTPEQISYFQLASVKGMIKLEKAGMKSRGGSVRKIWATHLGLKSTAKHDEVITEIQKRMDAMTQK